MLTGTECRDHLLSIAMVEPDHVPEGRNARLPEQTVRDVDAQQGNFCATAPNGGIKLVCFVDDRRVRICRKCQSVRKRMVRTCRVETAESVLLAASLGTYSLLGIATERLLFRFEGGHR